MFVPLIISLLFYNGSCLVIPIPLTSSKDLVKCVTDIVREYFAAQKMLTYVGNKHDDDEFLRAIHNLNAVAMMSRRSSQKLPVYHEGYFISARNATIFSSNFPNLSKESTWNPDARFLIMVKALEWNQLQQIFNALLKQHVHNVIVLNATADAHLYTYNPFDNYGCGKRYDDIVSLGKCSQAHTQNLFPDKYVTNLKNCTFTVAIPYLPPYTSLLPNENHSSSPFSYGMEPYFLRLVGKKEGFRLIMGNYDKQYNTSYSTVSSDMEAIGPLKLLQDNVADIVLGGLLLVPSRAVAFNYIYELLPYVDEIRFVVKQASLVPRWKNIYLEFDGTVWVLIVLSVVFYSMTMIILLRSEDKSLIVLKLLDNLLLHGCKLQCQSTVKAIFIIWVWFAYLINAFYQSSLVSLTTHPAKESQISTEEDIVNQNLQPCFPEIMAKYYLESTQSLSSYTPAPGCHEVDKSMKKVMKSKEHYTIFIYGLYEDNVEGLIDKYGNSRIYALKQPFSKVIYAMYFYKGFPLLHDLSLGVLRFREMGLVEKVISDINYLKLIKHHYHTKNFKYRFIMPWRVYIFGCTIAAITLIVEILSKHKY